MKAVTRSSEAYVQLFPKEKYSSHFVLQDSHKKHRMCCFLPLFYAFTLLQCCVKQLHVRYWDDTLHQIKDYRYDKQQKS